MARRLIQQRGGREYDANKSGQKGILWVALNGGAFTDDEMVNQLLTFRAACHETIATSMTWALLAVCRHPDAQKKLRDEVKERLPPTLGHTATTAELLHLLPYLHAVCNEILRLHPPAGMTKRVAAKNISILGQYVPKGSEIMVVMRAINHSKAAWGEDGAAFRPERLLESSSGAAGSDCSFMTFLHGESHTSGCLGGNTNVL